MMFNKDLAKEILSIPTYTGKEELIINFLTTYAKDNNITHDIDENGNVYFFKGELSEDEYYPCLVAHTDTVHINQLDLIENNKRLIIRENSDNHLSILTAYHPDTNQQTGIGGDDKIGIFIALELFNQFDKIMCAFFVKEETGCHGSKASKDEHFEKVGWVIQFDAPTDNWISKVCWGVTLFDKEFHELIDSTLKKHNQTKISIDPYTDVYILRPKYNINCINIFAGYEKMHTNLEYVVFESVEKSIKLGYDLIKLLGNTKYPYKSFK